MMLDEHEFQQAWKRMTSATKYLNDNAAEVGRARQVIEFASTLRANLLAKYAAQVLCGEKSAPKAEILARAMPGYLSELAVLQAAHEEAETIIQKERATRASYEAARTVISYIKETARL